MRLTEKTRPKRLVSTSMKAIVLSAIIGTAALAQDAVSATPELPAVAVDSEEFTKLPLETQARIFNAAVLESLDRINEVKPGFLDPTAKSIEFRNGLDPLKNIINTMSALQTDMDVGGKFSNVLELQISNTRLRMSQIEDDQRLSDDIRAELLENLEKQAVELKSVRADFKKLRDSIRDFIQIEAPGMQAEYDYRRQQEENAVIIRELRALRDTVSEMVLHLSGEPDPTEGAGD